MIIFKVVGPRSAKSGRWREERHRLPLLWLKKSFTILSSRLWKETIMSKPFFASKFSDFSNAIFNSFNSSFIKTLSAWNVFVAGCIFLEFCLDGTDFLIISDNSKVFSIVFFVLLITIFLAILLEYLSSPNWKKISASFFSSYEFITSYAL